MFFPVNACAFYSVTISFSFHANSIDYDPNLEWQSYCFLYLIYFPHESSESAPCKSKRCRVDLDDDMDFQSFSQST